MGFRELLSEVGIPACQEPRKNLRPARKRLQPARNKLQPARMQCQAAGKNSGSGSLMHILYPGFYAHDTRLLTSCILSPPWVWSFLGYSCPSLGLLRLLELLGLGSWSRARPKISPWAPLWGAQNLASSLGSWLLGPGPLVLGSCARGLQKPIQQLERAMLRFTKPTAAPRA